MMLNNDGIILARWQTSVQNVDCSPLEFYQIVEDYLRQSQLPSLSFTRISRNEGGWLSAKRIYLRIRYQKLFFDVSTFVSGSSLVIGWWLHQSNPSIPELLEEIPGIRFLLRKTVATVTYYQVDHLEYFQRAVHTTVLQVVEDLREENRLPLLPNEAKLPIWEDVW